MKSMKRLYCGVLLTCLTLLAAIQPTTILAETETIDLKALAKKARPSVLLLVVSDASGKEIATGTGFIVSSDGKLITNHHVIEGAASMVAKAENGGLLCVGPRSSGQNLTWPANRIWLGWKPGKPACRRLVRCVS